MTVRSMPNGAGSAPGGLIPAAFEALEARLAAVLKTGAHLRDWLPGDAVVEAPLYIPDDFPTGNCQVRVALLDPRTQTPAIRLAIEGRESDGWYRVGELKIVE